MPGPGRECPQSGIGQTDSSLLPGLKRGDMWQKRYKFEKNRNFTMLLKQCKICGAKYAGRKYRQNTPVKYLCEK